MFGEIVDFFNETTDVMYLHKNRGSVAVPTDQDLFERL